MNKSIIKLDDIDISLQSLLMALQMDEDDEYIDEIESIYQKGTKIAKPVALYIPFEPVFSDNLITINKIEFKEPFIYKMLTGCDIVVPYVASCGLEIDDWSKSFTDFFDQFIADTLKQLCLGFVREKLFTEVKEKFFSADKHTSTINPGSLEEWPISGQIPLFQVLGDVKNDINVELLDSLLMSPTKSVSGIIFQTDQQYHNCQLCPKPNCPGRHAPYNSDFN